MQDEGITVYTYGFDDSVGKMIIEIFEKMKAFQPENMEGYFNDIKDRVQKSFQNFYKEQPIQQALAFQNALMKMGGDNFHIDEQIAALEKITFNDLLDFNKRFFKTTRAECFIYGNITPEEAINAGQEIEEILYTLKEDNDNLDKDFVPEVRVIEIPENTTWFYEHHIENSSDSNESNSAIITLFQHKKETPYMTMLLSVLANYLKDPCFNMLRTVENLGYIVHSQAHEIRGILHFAIMV